MLALHVPVDMIQGYAIEVKTWPLRVVSSIVLVLSLSAFGLLPAYAEEIQIPCPGGGNYSVTLPAGVATNGKSCAGALDVDSRVKIIGKEAFSFSKITSVNLPNSVTLIEAHAFSYTNFLTINLGKSITSIGTEAFRLARFQSIELPNTLKTIGECAFCDTYFTTIKLPDSLVSIGRSAFVRDDNRVPLKSIEIPDSVVEIGWHAFSAVSLETLKLGNSVREIMPGAFERNKLRKVEFPKSIKYIGGFSFKDNPIEEVTFPDGLIGIDIEGFANTRLKSISLPETAQKLGKRAFADIPTLKSVTIRNFTGQYQTDGTYTVGDLFEGSYAISEIFYCGTLKGFIIEPVCNKDETPAPKVESEVKPTVPSPPKEATNSVVVRPSTITCVKGKTIRKVSAIKPKCPSGYKKKIATRAD